MKTSKGSAIIPSSNLFPVVGIGASAGGLEAFKKLVAAIPVDSGMAYVLVQHLDPNHHSILPALLQKVTTIPVLEISDEIKVEPNHIYIIPSNKMLVANDGLLQLTPRPPKSTGSLNLPIDLFFTSLAEVHQSHAIGVVLSGTASDGTAGLRAIKDHGGVTFAQDEASAAYDQMPSNAARAGVVDFILPPEQIPAKLAAVVKFLSQSDAAIEDNAAKDDDFYTQILFLLRIRKGTDFTYYKRPTICRRILRRMAIKKIEKTEDYLNYLQEHKEEQDFLYQDLLIPVTSFFRDPQVFELLVDTTFPTIIKAKKISEPVRIWVAGCSTGQEAYSLAIVLRELMGNGPMKAQIFATDISEPAIVKARGGIYTPAEVAGVSPARLQAYFTKTEGGYRVSNEIRDMCVFASHNFLKDPPFSKIDFVSCRNVLIYLEPYLQKKALTTFHYALMSKGFLLLGKSETGSGVPQLFSITDKRSKLLVRKDVPGKYIHVANHFNTRNLPDLDTNSQAEPMHTDFLKAADDIILSKYTPPGVVINEAMEIVHFRGNTSTYLEQTAGKPTHNLLKMARNALAFELRNTIQKSRKEQVTVFKENISFEVAGLQKVVTIEVVPMPGIADPHSLVIFHDKSDLNASALGAAVASTAPDARDIRNLQLERELSQNREDMRNITADQESANDDLQSTNEELLSNSEELQSLNEELETSKEELQSTNEELTVLNQELSSLNDQLNAASDDQTVLRKRMEVQALMTNNLLMTAPGFICTIAGPDHVYEMVNDRYQQLFGKRKIQGKPMLEALPELEGQGLDRLLEIVYNTGEPYVGIEQPLMLARDEHLAPEERYFNFSYQPMFNEDQQVYAILMFGYEVTEQVNARDKIADIHKAHAKELEECVTQRTAELHIANEALLQKNEVLLSMNKDLESFTYVSSHDLQEPLRKIQMFAAHILSKEYAVLSDDGKDSFVRINNAAGRMQRLIQDLLTYSHTNITERKFEVYNLNRIVEEVLSENAETILEKGAVLTVGVLGDAWINLFQFRQVLENLIGNALKFMRPGINPQIIISTKVAKGLTFKIEHPDMQLNMLSAEKMYIQLSINDNGIGFEPQYKDRIFEVFQRLHSKDAYAGTGIGLSIVKKIIAQHNGVVTAIGELNKGATFNIYLPVL